MDMNYLPNIFFNKQNEFRSVRTPTDRKKDITGRILMQVLMPAGEVKSSIDLTDLAGGVYTYNCFVGNVKHSTGKLIKY